MKNSGWIIGLIFMIGLQINSSPASDAVEITAALCHFSDAGLRCSCSEEAKEDATGNEKLAKKVKRSFQTRR